MATKYQSPSRKASNFPAQQCDAIAKVDRAIAAGMSLWAIKNGKTWRWL